VSLNYRALQRCTTATLVCDSLSKGQTRMVSVECEIPMSGSVRVSETEDSPPDWCHPAKLFIGGLPRQTSTQQLRDHFSKHGRVVDCVVMRWSDGRSRGFGYITYDNAESANACLKAPQTLDGRVVDVKRAVPGTNKLFVGGLPQGVTAAELRTYFSSFGPVSDAVVMMDSATGRSRGFGFVCFAPGPEGATAIAGALANYDQHQLRGKWIEVKSAAPPQELAKGNANDVPPELLLPPSTPSSLQSAPITPMSQYSPCQTMLGYNPRMPIVSSPHSLLHRHQMSELHQIPLMSAHAPEFVPTGEDMLYNHMMQADRYCQEQMHMNSLYPGGRPPATPHSDRGLGNAHAELEKANQFGMPPMDQRAFAAVRSLEQEDNVPPPPQHAPSEPQWPLFASESSETVTTVMPPPPVLPGDAAAGFAPATGFFAANNDGSMRTPTISPQLGVARPPPGLEDEATNNFIDPMVPVCVEIPPVMQDMCTQTEGPACRACGASFGCAGKCPWSRDQLLGLREAFLRTKVEPKDPGALKAVRYSDTAAARKKAGGA